MFSRTIMGLGAILMAIIISLTTLLAWPDYLQYIWAAIIVIWGIINFMQR